MRIGHHRHRTTVHTWHVDWKGRAWFVKANPHRAQAEREIRGHARIRGHYVVPDLLWARRFGRWTLLAYHRWPYANHDAGLLCDEITHADLTGDRMRLDACLNGILDRYRTVIADTARLVTFTDTALYGDRLSRGGRIDRYYSTDSPWLTLPGGWHLRPSTLATTRLIINGRDHQIDFADHLARLRIHFAARNPTWAALTQGEPTDLNLGWAPQSGPVWFGYDTSGLNVIAGEFACFLLGQRLHGAWLTPTYHPAAYRDHPSALLPVAMKPPTVRINHTGAAELQIDYTHHPSPARQHTIRRYLHDVAAPIATLLQVDDLMDWLRPYLVLHLLATTHLGHLHPRDTALVLGLLADLLHPETTLHDVLALTNGRSAARRVHRRP